MLPVASGWLKSSFVFPFRDVQFDEVTGFAYVLFIMSIPFWRTSTLDKLTKDKFNRQGSYLGHWWFWLITPDEAHELEQFQEENLEKQIQNTE